MKRLLAGMLCAVLLAIFSMPAVGETEVTRGLFELYDESGESASWLGVAAPVFPGLLATSAGNLPGDTANLSVTDGLHRWDVQEVYAEETFPVAFMTYDSETEPASLEAWPFRMEPGLPSADSIYVLSAAEGGDRLYRTPTAATPMKWQGLDCMLLTLPTPVVPGSPVLTDGNELAGMIAAVYAEGKNRYIAVTAGGIFRRLASLGEKEDELSGNPPEGFTAEPEGNAVTFDWTGVKIPEADTDGEELYLVVADTGNHYLNYFPVEKDMTSVSMLLTPGRTYVSGLLRSADAPDRLPEQYAVVKLPEAERLTEYAFRPNRTALVLTDGREPAADGSEPDAGKVTEEQILGGKVWFYSSSSYEIDAQQERTLLITMTTPDGENYRYVSAWYYDPGLQTEDAWSISFETMEFTEALKDRDCRPGMYRIDFYIGGALADSFSFELVK